MKVLIIVILLATGGIVTGIAQLGDGQIFITVTSEGKAKVTQSLFPETFVSTIDVKIISEKISNLLAIDEENILLGTSQNQDLLKIATLGSSSVNLKYNADILSYESGVFKLKYNSELESRVNLPPLSKLVSLNTIPIEITDEEYILPPGEISISFSIRPVTSKEFFVPVDDSQYKIEAITAAKIEGFSANSEQIQFIIKDKAIVLTIIPTKIMANPNDASLNGEKVDFTQFHKNSTHSWIRIDPHEKGLVKILDTSEKIEDGGGCLIATATYGSEMAPQVQLLREIRDNQLMNTNSGVSFMTGFNSLYYSFSPDVSDLERENPMFKEIVKIGITPLLSSLSVMEYAETDEEILGLGISVILMNVGMYFVFPFVICYQGMRLLRTKCLRKSNLVVISNCNVRSVLKIGIIGLIALFVLSVSVPSAFAQSTESESPIIMVLEITHQNILDSLDAAGINPEDDPYYAEAKIQYDAAIAAVNDNDVIDAKNSALIAMALFEKSAEEIGALEEQASTQLPSGLGAGIGSASDIGVTQGQGLGVGGIPSGILQQITAANVFDVSEQISDIEEEVNELRQLAESNGIDVNLEDYDESINLAKTVLANGEIPNAQAKIGLANEIKGEIYAEIQKAAADNAREDIEELLDDQKNLGLTKKAVNDLQGILDDITTESTEEIGTNDVPVDNQDEAPGKSGEAPGQNKADSGDEVSGKSGEAPGQNKADSGDEAPGKSGEAPGQNNDNDETDLPPGFDASTENGNGLGIGKVPPGLAKLFENGDADLPPGFDAATENGNGLGIGNIPPGQAKKFDDYSASFEQSADDFFENSYEAQIDDVFEINFDGTNKGNGDGKGKFGAWAGKSGEDPKIKIAKDSKNRNSNNGGGADTIICHLPNSVNKTLKLSGNALTPHLAHGDTLGACSSGSSNDGSVTITAGGIPDDSTAENVNYVVDVTNYFDDIEDADTAMTYTGTDADVSGNNNMITSITSGAGTTLVTVDPGQNKVGVSDITIRATDTAGNFVEDTFRLTIGTTGAPDAPTNQSASQGSGTSIDVSWDAPADNGGSNITGYQIERLLSEPGAPNWIVIVANTGNTNTTHNDSTVTQGEDYRYRISAINAVPLTGSSSGQTGWVTAP